MTEQELMKLTPGELTDLGICPTCFNREHNGALYGDNRNRLLYADEDIECFFVGNPRADGHMCISTIAHYHDMSEAPDSVNEKIIRYAKCFMNIIKEIFQCERVYLCTMCDGLNNHYHVQLIPRYSYEKRGSKNFVKPRKEYVFDEEKFNSVKERILEYSKMDGFPRIDAELRKIDYENAAECIALSVTEEQGRHIASNQKSLREAAENPAVARPFAIYIDNKMVGFTMFAFDEACEDPSGRYWLWRFMIDKEFQHRGYGHAALKEIIRYFKAQGADSIRLSTMENNREAISLYHEFGWRENGEMNDEEIVLELDL